MPALDLTFNYFNMEDPVVGGFEPEKVALRRAISLAYKTHDEMKRHSGQGVGGGIALDRSQATVDDRSFMRAMIPHHSLAITRSERFNVEDVRVCELAVEISDGAFLRNVK